MEVSEWKLEHIYQLAEQGGWTPEEIVFKVNVKDIIIYLHETFLATLSSDEVSGSDIQYLIYILTEVLPKKLAFSMRVEMFDSVEAELDNLYDSGGDDKDGTTAYLKKQIEKTVDNVRDKLGLSNANDNLNNVTVIEPKDEKDKGKKNDKEKSLISPKPLDNEVHRFNIEI